MPLNQLLNQLTEYLEQEIDSGASPQEIRPDILAGLAASSTHLSVPVPPNEHPAQASDETEAGMARLAKAISGCKKCDLHETRTHAVPGQGSFAPDIAFVGEAPGADEDQQGLAFIGRAGQLLTKMILAMGFQREEVFIGNILKCRPPNNRKPMPDEMETCMPYLKQQLAFLRPKVIIALGATAVHGLLDISQGITKIRGTWYSFEGIDVMPTFHPAYLLRDPHKKREVWEDLKTVLRHIGRPIPKPGKK